jgi:outer membrane lipoprotein-sorting protein
MYRARSLLATRLLICGMICSGGSLASDATDRAPTDLAALMELFARSGGVRAHFRESRHLSILTDPIETTGTLYFAPPDRLARHATRPGRSSIVVEAGRVSLGDETGQRVYDFETSEVARALVGNLMIVLRGDLESLKAQYSISFDSDGENWTLDLEPRSRVLRGIIERIRFTGQSRELNAMETSETNGDRTIMRFSEIAIGLSWEHGDLDRIFSLDPSDPAS